MIFCLQRNIRVSYKPLVLLLVDVAMCAESTPPKNKFVISLKYFKKKVKDKYAILHEDKHQSFLQAGSIAFTDHSQACPKY